MTRTRSFLISATFACAALLSMTGVQAQADDHSHHDHGAASAPAGDEWTAGEIRRIDVAQGRLTLKHGEIRNLDMPPMTMAFRLKQGLLTAAQLAQLKVGDKVDFKVESQHGQTVITALQPTPSTQPTQQK